MAGDFGLSFSPTDQAHQTAPQGLSPVQEAIKVLSLRLPQQGGASAITPGALLTAPGGMGGGGGPMDLLAILRRLLMPGGGLEPGAGAAPPMGNAPVPNVGVGAPPHVPIFGGPPLPPSVGHSPIAGTETQPITGDLGGAPPVDRTNPLPGNKTSPFDGGRDWLRPGPRNG